MSSSTNKRHSTDFKELMKSYKVVMANDKMGTFFVHFHGPEDSLYKGGVWMVQVVLGEDYPKKPPIILFDTLIYHPNIEKDNGYVCVDALDEKWCPEYNLITVFDFILPMLLREPNPMDALNQEAGYLMIRNLDAYNRQVKEYCEKHAKPEYAAGAAGGQSSDEALNEDSARSDGEEIESSTGDGGSREDSDSVDCDETEDENPDP